MAFRDILKVFDDDLASAEKALQNVGDGEVGIVVDLARVRFDLRRDGQPAEDESLAYILASLSQRPGAQIAAPTPLEVRFDTGDAAWLAGYSQVPDGSLQLPARARFSQPRTTPRSIGSFRDRKHR